MKKKIVKIIASALACAVSASMISGCGGNETEKLEIAVQVNGQLESQKEQILKKWEGYSDIPIEWRKVDVKNLKEQIGLIFSSGDYPDVILGNIFQDSDISQYAANEVLIPLEDYITEETTPNLYRFFQNHPKAKAMSTLTDGHIYSLPKYCGLEFEYLENVLFINKVWLDKLGLKVPHTTEELYNVLKAFKTGDPNGNGLDDEIPMTFFDGHGSAYPEVLLSFWGVTTKSGNYEGYLTVKDGKVEFAPMCDEWKEMIKYAHKLYSEGLIDMECFTQNIDQYNAKLASATSVVGMAWDKTCPAANSDEYVAIEPIHAPGYETLWHIHPGINAVKNVFSITNACKNPEAAMKWVDKFYTMEETIENWYGSVGTVFTVDESGKYIFNEPEDGKSLSTLIAENTLSKNFPGTFYAEELDKKIEYHSMWKESTDNYEIYKPYIDTEPWPRPYYDVNDSKRITELRTDLFDFVDRKKAKWIVGTDDVEADWEAYKESLVKMNVEEYVSINQKAYDNYLKALN